MPRSGGEQLPGCVGSKLWSAVGVSVEGIPNVANVSLKVWASPMAVGGWGDDGPARVAIDQHQVCCTLVMEVTF